VILDASAILAIFFAEKHSAWVASRLNQEQDLRMSTVNLTECLIHIRDRQPADADRLQQQLMNSGIAFVAPDVEQASLAAEARLRLPLNLGDCYAYALAKQVRQPLLTLDLDFRRADIELIFPE
jgi:ribonuclease VapC